MNLLSQCVSKHFVAVLIKLQHVCRIAAQALKSNALWIISLFMTNITFVISISKLIISSLHSLMFLKDFEWQDVQVVLHSVACENFYVIKSCKVKKNYGNFLFREVKKWWVKAAISFPQCGNCGIPLSCNFGKSFVKVTVLLNKLLKSRFDEIFFWWSLFTLCTKSLPKKSETWE